MSDRFFVDTNILVYCHDRSTGPKHERAKKLVEELWDSGAGVLSTQVLQELCVNLRRKAKRPFSINETREILQDYSSWRIVVNTEASIVAALAIEERYGLSFWDALVVQAAESCGAKLIYSEDLSDGQVYGSVRVANPLK